MTPTRISSARWSRRIVIALLVLGLAIAVAALAFQAWAIVSGSDDAMAIRMARRTPVEMSMNREGGER